jgi:hypothetical protein
VNNDTWGGRMPPNDPIGSHQRGFLYWWFSHMPAFAGQHGIVSNNWWPYVFDMNLPVASADAAAPTRKADQPAWVCVDGHVYPMVDGKVQLTK